MRPDNFEEIWRFLTKTSNTIYSTDFMDCVAVDMNYRINFLLTLEKIHEGWPEPYCANIFKLVPFRNVD